MECEDLWGERVQSTTGKMGPVVMSIIFELDELVVAMTLVYDGRKSIWL